MRLLGFDSGGQRRFGWTVFNIGDSGISVSLRTGVCSNATSALHSANGVDRAVPCAIKIDAPLFWAAAGDDRQADTRIRKLVRAAGGSSGRVSHVNSVRGACLVQGVLAARSWPRICRNRPPSINETQRLPRMLRGQRQLPSLDGVTLSPMSKPRSFHAVARFPVGYRGNITLHRADTPRRGRFAHFPMFSGAIAAARVDRYVQSVGSGAGSRRTIIREQPHI